MGEFSEFDFEWEFEVEFRGGVVFMCVVGMVVWSWWDERAEIPITFRPR